MELTVEQFLTKSGHTGIVKKFTFSEFERQMQEMINGASQESIPDKDIWFCGYVVVVQTKQYSTRIIEKACKNIKTEYEISYKKELSEFCLDENQEGYVLGFQCQNLEDAAEGIESFSKEIKKALENFRNRSKYAKIKRLEKKITAIKEEGLNLNIDDVINKSKLPESIKEELRTKWLDFDEDNENLKEV